MFLPLAALLLIISNIEMVARTTKKFAKEVIERSTVQTAPQSETVDIPELPVRVTEVATLQDKKNNQKEKKAVPPPPPAPPKMKALNDSVIPAVKEEMPTYPGGQYALSKFIAENVKYPLEAQEKGTQGRVIVSFIINKDGSISDAEVVRGLDPALDKEAKRIINAMPNWIPATRDGQPISVKFTLPVTFRLSSPKKEAEVPVAVAIKESDLSEVVVTGYAPKEEAPVNEPTFKVVEEMPKFPGGEAALFRYLAQNMKYPAIAQKNKQQGTVVIQMTIGKDGNLSNIKVLSSVSPSLDAEAVRVVSGMPKWEAGKQRGENVAVEYTLPITFRLQ